ncbi:MAG: MBL fold metallo-hydrolase [Candidatus Diapherotrites archaeon]|nr:MBL fold metallo-hydrolase [Candidatus Diapherotrites archaeon]
MIDEISKNVFFIQSSNQSCNAFLLVGRKIALIDTGLSSNAGFLEKSLVSIGFSPDDIELVLHTHGHADHFCADSLFKKAQIRMGEFDAFRVSMKDAMFSYSESFGETFFPKISSSFQANEFIQISPFNLQVIATPGHTEGSVCFFEKSKKLLFSGDTLFNNGVGRFDLISGSGQRLHSSLDVLARLDFEILLPGHGAILKTGQKQNIKNAVETLFV